MGKAKKVAVEGGKAVGTKRARGASGKVLVHVRTTTYERARSILPSMIEEAELKLGHSVKIAPADAIDQMVAAYKA